MSCLQTEPTPSQHSDSQPYTRRIAIDEVTGQLAPDYRTRFLGTRPVKLFPVIIQGNPAVLAISSRSWLIYNYQGRYQVRTHTYTYTRTHTRARARAHTHTHTHTWLVHNRQGQNKGIQAASFGRLGRMRV